MVIWYGGIVVIVPCLLTLAEGEHLSKRVKKKTEIAKVNRRHRQEAG